MPGDDDDDGPAVVVQLAGLAALVALAFIDAWSEHWNPDPLAYWGGIGLILWGPSIIPAIGRKN